MPAEEVNGMKKNASSVNFVTLSASEVPRLLSTSDMSVTKDRSELSVRHLRSVISCATWSKSSLLNVS